MKKRTAAVVVRLLGLLLLVFCAGWIIVVEAGSDSSSITFYVATDGNDAWSGRFPVPNANGTDGPFATIYQARDATSAYIGQYAITVYIREGIYYLPETVYMTPAHSGTQEYPISYSYYPGDASPVLSGGIPVTNWTQTTNSLVNYSPLWKASVTLPTSESGDLFYPRSLFVNDNRATRARNPNGLYEFLYWTEALSMDGGSMGFVYQNDDIVTYYNMDDVMIVAFHSWTASYHYIAQLFESNQTVVFTNSGSSLSQFEVPSGKRYYLENALEFVDSAGEWYYDATTGDVYYAAAQDEDPNEETIVLALLEQIFSANGLQYVSFNNISFQHSDWNCWKTEICDGQSASFQNSSALNFAASTNIAFDNCAFEHLGHYSIWFNTGTQYASVSNCAFDDLGTGGVRVGDEMGGTNNVVINNSIITNGGKVYQSGCGILSQKASDNTYTHNEIGNLFYTGISVGWDWQYDPINVSLAMNNLVAYNYIHDIGGDLLSDMGCIYTLGESPNTVIHNNLCHDVFTYNYGGWCIYPDQASSFMTYTNNICYKTESAPLHQHFGWQNTIMNNIFAFGGYGEPGNIQPDGALRTDPDPGQKNSFFLLNNIIYWTNGTLFYGDFDTSTDPQRNYTFNYNLYFSPNASFDYVFPNGQTFTQWQQQGYDGNSLVGVDPLFVNPNEFDFTLSPDSPALKLGFQPIDTSIIGPI
eukprot:TRINITY_DN6281_c0_g1_i1.p1 TRINITY_DN6281_c0_g1~~TRINITY_DN6281_c0_g1_i1.p1  ORF type:complete len:712 (-),score=131.99 TRINITY_DN6281_c0_g1_i1:54-2150(-)